MKMLGTVPVYRHRSPPVVALADRVPSGITEREACASWYMGPWTRHRFCVFSYVLQLVYSVARRVAHMQVAVRKRQTGTQAQTELRGWDCVFLLRSGPDIRSKSRHEAVGEGWVSILLFPTTVHSALFLPAHPEPISFSSIRISCRKGCDCSVFPIPSSRGRPCSSLTHHLALGATELLQLRKQHSLSGPVGLHPHA